MMRNTGWSVAVLGWVILGAATTPAMAQDTWLPGDFKPWNVTPHFEPQGGEFKPVAVGPFIEHVRRVLPDMDGYAEAKGIRVENGAVVFANPADETVDGLPVTASARQGDLLWQGTAKGLYSTASGGAPARHPSYGVDGPLATRITGLAVDSKGVLWVGTPLGLSRRDGAGAWTSIRGREGLPYEDVTTLALTVGGDELWIGTSQGAILYKPYQEGRQWFYRAGKRYLPGNLVRSIAVAPDGNSVYFLTDGGVGKIELVKTTLLERAQTIEKRVNTYHRRMGLVADCDFNDANEPATHSIGDNDNDGLWTAYHVAAMSLCYGATKDAAAKQSAGESMRALYMLQNVSGIPGLVARSVLPPELGKLKGPQWRLSPDGSVYWKSDTSSDEIDGHYLAFYAYYEHIAKDDPAEKAVLEKQVRALTDHIVGNNYQLIDWTGRRTYWGFWNPEMLNGDKEHYVENGLNALQILSFLKVAHHITGDGKYEEHFRKLAVEHHYLSNILISKKVFPDENNHSDDQLGFVAWYPILQLEKDPGVRALLGAGVRRHYSVVKPEKPSFYTFAYATIDPMGADIAGAAENLMEIPTDRRWWDMKNSIRTDVQISTMRNRFRQPVLTRVLPADEREFKKWNGDPYRADIAGDGRREDDGAAYLLPYWMGRFHGFITEAQ